MPVPVKMADLFTIAASNSPAGSDPIGNSLDDYLRATQAIIRSTNALASATIAAASTVDLGTADAESVQITGSASITSLGTVAAGIVRECRFSGSCTIVASTSIALPGSTNITTNAGDVLTFRSLGSGNWVMTEGSAVYGYLALTGGTLTGGLTLQPASGQATLRLTTASGQAKAIQGFTSSTARWQVQIGNGTSESGSNAGSDFQIDCFSDAGSSLFTPLIIQRSTGVAQFSSRPTFAGNTAWDAGNFNPANYAQLSGSNFTGLVSMGNGASASTSGSQATLILTDTGSNGANLKFVGNGVTTPNKTIRATNGSLQFVNSAYNAVISSLSDGGVWTAADFQATSDERLKRDIKQLDMGISHLARMAPISYVKGDRNEIGFSAQKVMEVIPQAVSANDDGMLTVSHPQITALIAAAVLEIVSRLERAGI